jgi:hypothetical protein
MLNWALRETVTKLLFGKPMLPGPGFFPLSYSLLILVYLVAVLVPSGGWGRHGKPGQRRAPQLVTAGCRPQGLRGPIVELGSVCHSNEEPPSLPPPTINLQFGLL